MLDNLFQMHNIQWNEQRSTFVGPCYMDIVMIAVWSIWKERDAFDPARLIVFVAGADADLL
jgi:hypothetical protein